MVQMQRRGDVGPISTAATLLAAGRWSVLLGVTVVLVCVAGNIFWCVFSFHGQVVAHLYSISRSEKQYDRESETRMAP